MKSWQKNLAAVLFGASVVLLAELGLRLLSFHSGACDLDPFVSFQESVPVLVESGSGSAKIVEINPRLKSYFNNISFPKEKTPNTRRIFVLGGSDVLGFPFLDQGSFPRFLSLGLNRLDPGHQYQVVNLGGFGYASYRVLKVLKDALNYEPDLVIVMTGHNEFLEKREYAAPEKISRLRKKLQGLKIYCLLKTVVFKIRPAPKKPRISTEVKWEKFTVDPVMRERVIEHYKFNLAEMAAAASEKKTPLLLLTLPSNLKDFPPFHSEHRKNLGEAELWEWRDLSRESEKLISENKSADAALVLKKEIRIDPEYAFDWYRLGQCLLATGADQEARSAFEQALEKDSWQVRALPEFNNYIRGLSGPARVLDLAPVFDQASPGGVPGDNLFYDHCHPRLETQALIAKEIVRKLGEDNFVQLPDIWETDYDMISRAYIDSLPKPVLAQAYYRLAVEIGVNMGLKDLGKRYLELGLEADPQHQKLKKLAEILK